MNTKNCSIVSKTELIIISMLAIASMVVFFTTNDPIEQALAIVLDVMIIMMEVITYAAYRFYMTLSID